MALDSIALGRWERVRSGLVIGLFIAALMLLVWSSNGFKQTQLRLSGLYYLPSTPPDNIVIVGLDDKSLEAYGRSPLDWSRSLYADLVTQVSKAGARVVAFDIMWFGNYLKAHPKLKVVEGDDATSTTSISKASTQSFIFPRWRTTPAGTSIRSSPGR